MADYMSSVFGSVADDMADAFITSFKESGQAALDYADIMDGVASQIAKDIIKSTLLQNVFTDELTKDAAKKLASGDTAGAMAIVDEAMKSAAALAPYIQEFLEQIEPYFQMEEEKPENTLGSGIKGITEDTANLLASYLQSERMYLTPRHYGKECQHCEHFGFCTFSDGVSGSDSSQLTTHPYQRRTYSVAERDGIRR